MLFHSPLPLPVPNHPILWAYYLSMCISAVSWELSLSTLDTCGPMVSKEETKTLILLKRWTHWAKYSRVLHLWRQNSCSKANYSPFLQPQSALLIQTFDISTKLIIIMTIWIEQIFTSEWDSYSRILLLMLQKEHMVCMFAEAILTNIHSICFLSTNKKKRNLSFRPMFGFFIMANFFLTARSEGTNTVIITGVLCMIGKEN